MNYYFAGSFSPPTYGHLDIVRRFLSSHDTGSLIIICSKNPNKDKNMFTPEQCVEMWQIYLETLAPKYCYVRAFTLEKAMTKFTMTPPITVVRGLRNHEDMSGEADVVRINSLVDQFLYIRGGKEYEDCSSTRAREAMSHDGIRKYLHPEVIKLCRKFLNLNEQREGQNE